MKRNIVFVSVLFIAICLSGLTTEIKAATNNNTELEKIFAEAIEAVGGQDEISKIRNIEAFADCVGPKGKYTTKIKSFRDNITYFKQTFTYTIVDSIIYINNKTGWKKNLQTNELEIVSPFQTLVVNLHEYQKMAFDFQRMFSDFKLVGDENFNQKPSVKVSVKNDLGGTIYLFFDKKTKLLAGYILPIPNSNPSVRNVFNEWKKFGKIKLPSVITATDPAGDWVLNFNQITLNSTTEELFSVPPRVKDYAELVRLHREHQTAHLSYDAELFVKSFADEVTHLQRGQVKTQDKAANLKRFKDYFASYKFIEWEDIKPPVINISQDGTLATVIVEKRVRGTYKNDQGEEEKDHSIFAWLEVWEKIEGKWKITTIASTAREGDKK
jgi:hypothetical protein